MCHECGEWLPGLWGHLKEHKLSARTYKLKHGLPLKTALCNETVRISIATAQKKLWQRPAGYASRVARLLANTQGKQTGRGHAPFRPSNFRGQCRAQMLEKTKKLASRIKRTPSYTDLREAFGFSSALIQKRFGNLRSLQRLANLVPRAQGDGTGFKQRYTDEMILHMLGLFWRVHGREPSYSDCKRGYLPSPTTIWSRFGSLRKALRMLKEAAVPTEKVS